MTYWVQQWFPMMIMCQGLKNLTRNLGMILQAPTHLQHLLFLLHMTFLHLLLPCGNVPWQIHLRSCLEWPMLFYDGICSAKPCWGKLPRRYALWALFLSGIAIIVLNILFYLLSLLFLLWFSSGYWRFLHAFHDFRFTILNLPPLPADRSNFDVHGATIIETTRTVCLALKQMQ